MSIPCDTCHMPGTCTRFNECRDTAHHDLNGNRRKPRSEAAILRAPLRECGHPACWMTDHCPPSLEQENARLRANARASLWGIMGGALAVIVVVAALIIRSHGP